ncbi:TlpA family protein disulfide reductase [Azoarcus olearius]|uniref:Conserved hypothetical thioredoxin n=1 Tax=Azoarcus sp. (strain BH72) TaxID=418699 RepID=A1K3S8_AZOSB|nr:conserved hypothetical thioredoxin [Azoarcus olearius]
MSMRSHARTLVIALVAVLAAVAGYFASRPATPPTTRHSAAALYALQLPDAAGQPQSLAAWKDKVLVVNFWATWCPPCRKEIPDFSAASRTFADQPVQFVGISIDTPDKVQAFADEFEVPYPLLIAGPAQLELTAAFGNTSQALPFTLLIDRDGNVRASKLGTLNRAELEGKIRTLLAP